MIFLLNLLSLPLSFQHTVTLTIVCKVQIFISRDWMLSNYLYQIPLCQLLEMNKSFKHGYISHKPMHIYIYTYTDVCLHTNTHRHTNLVLILFLWGTLTNTRVCVCVCVYVCE
jgi:hypothetical protein